MSKIGKTFAGPTYKLLLNFTVISDFYMSSIPNKTTFTKCCLTQWISKLSGRCWAGQIVLIFNDVYIYENCEKMYTYYIYFLIQYKFLFSQGM